MSNFVNNPRNADGTFTVKYVILSGAVHQATFSDLISAQLFWDTVVYLRNTYKGILSNRPN